MALLAVALFLLIALFRTSAQETAMPIFLGQQATMIPPAVDGSGRTVVFGSAITPDGVSLPTMDIYSVGSEGTGLRRLTRLGSSTAPSPQGALAVSLTPDGLWAAFSTINSAGKGEEIHLLDVARASDKTLAVDTQGCIQPLASVCVNCFFACVRAPHVTPDGSAVLYAVSRQPTFYVARNDGSPPRSLPIYLGGLAPSPQRVISRSGRIVFTSNAPNGPTFAPSASNVYGINLDGTEMRPVTQFNDPSVYARDATISADGTVIAFLANFDPSTGKATQSTQIFTIRSDGTSLRQITFGADSVSSPSLNGDGRQIAFLRGQDVFVVTSDCNTGAQLTSFRFSTAGNAVISEDGTRIIFTVGPPDGSPRGGGIGAVYAASLPPFLACSQSLLTVAYAPRTLNPNGITGAAQAFDTVVAGSLASAYGLNFTSDTFALASTLPLPETLAGVSLTLNGVPLPLLSVGPWQINAQIPPGISAGPVALEVRFQDGFRTAPVAQNVKAFGPAIFLLPPGPGGGFIRGAVFHAGTATPVDPQNPATPGEALEIYASGLGPTNPFVPAGAPAPAKPPATTVAQPQVMVGRLPARVLFSGLAPGYVGLYQVNIETPAGAPQANAVPLTLGIAGTTSSSVTISVK